MPAGIEKFDKMVSTGGKAAWHGLDVVLDQPYLLSHEVNEAAGLTWEAGLYPSGAITCVDINGQPIVDKINPSTILPFDAGWIVVRKDIMLPLAQVGARYRLIQNYEAPLYLDNLVGSKEGQYVTAGSLQNGRKTWWLMNLPGNITVGGDSREKIETYLLLNNSFDGTLPLIVAVVTVRVVCQNTLKMALDGAERVHKIRHTQNAMNRYEEARQSLTLGFKYQETLLEVAERLANEKFNESRLNSFFDNFAPLKSASGELKTGRELTNAMQLRDGVTGALRRVPDLAHIKDNGWGVLQAVSHYNDHERGFRETRATTANENRFIDLVGLGNGENLTDKAYRILTANLK